MTFQFSKSFCYSFVSKVPKQKICIACRRPTADAPLQMRSNVMQRTQDNDNEKIKWQQQAIPHNSFQVHSFFHLLTYYYFLFFWLNLSKVVQLLLFRDGQGPNGHNGVHNDTNLAASWDRISVSACENPASGQSVRTSMSTFHRLKVQPRCHWNVSHISRTVSGSVLLHIAHIFEHKNLHIGTVQLFLLHSDSDSKRRYFFTSNAGHFFLANKKWHTWNSFSATFQLYFGAKAVTSRPLLMPKLADSAVQLLKAKDDP